MTPEEKQAWIARITSGDVVRTITDVEMSPRGGEMQSQPVSRVTVTMDEAAVPFARADIELAAELHPEIITPAKRLSDVRITAGLAHADATWTAQLAHLVYKTQAYANGRRTLTAVSDEDLIQALALGPEIPETACPQSKTLGGIWGQGPASKLTFGNAINVRDLAQIPGDRQSEVWAQPYGGGDSPLDWLLTQADIAALWVHSDQSPDSAGGMLAETRPQINYLDYLDLRTAIPGSLVIDHSSDLGIVDDFASAVYLTCRWTESGKSMESSGLVRAANPGLTPVVKKIDLQMRPPTAYRTQITRGWYVAQQLADRLAARTWNARYVTPCLPWVRPGDTARTSYGYGIVKEITFDLTLGTQTLTVRPI